MGAVLGLRVNNLELKEATIALRYIFHNKSILHRLPVPPFKLELVTEYRRNIEFLSSCVDRDR